MNTSPYEGKSEEEWLATTQELLGEFPLTSEQLVDAVLTAWQDIFESKIGVAGAQIGKDIFPQPQIIGFLLHELIPLVIAKRHSNKWCRDRTGHEKDLVCLEDDKFSMEIKTSSHATGIFGNRSFAQPETQGKKNKSGYYLLINFEKCSRGSKDKPKIRRIRFAWLDHSDWKGQTAESGQQASLKSSALSSKIITLYPPKAKAD